MTLLELLACFNFSLQTMKTHQINMIQSMIVYGYVYLATV